MHPYSRPDSTSGAREADDGGEHDDSNDYSPDSGDHGAWHAQSASGASEGVRHTKEKKGLIARVNRACNNCRRMKMRCVGADDPPCKRCRNAGLECVMEKPGRNHAEQMGDDRLRSLENTVSTIQDTLTDLVATLKSHTTPPQPLMSISPTPAFGMGQLSPFDGPIRSAPSSQGNTAYRGPPNAGLSTLATPGSSFHTSRQQPPFAPVPIDRTFGPFSRAHLHSRGPPDRPSGPMEMPQVRIPPQQHPWPQSAVGAPALMSSPQPTHLAPARPLNMNPEQSPEPLDRTENDRPYSTLPPSRAVSLGPDELDSEGITNPLGAMSSMAGLVEAAVERAREEQAKALARGRGTSSRKRSPEQPAASHRSGKKSRTGDQRVTGHMITENQNLPPALPGQRGKDKSQQTHTHAFPDAVDEGIVPESEGREMVKLFYAGSSNFIPCYDPEVDTWESLRQRSPFSITAMIMVGARVRDAGGRTSDVQRNCRSHAEKIANSTLFNPVSRIEAVQAMILLATFSDESGWLPGGHAVRMAIDLGINQAFLLLLKSGMGAGKSKAELEEERPLVVQARVWFCLYLMEHQMAYGTGRPAILREDEAIHKVQRLLEHPLSITSDARLVSTVHLLSLRAPLHIELTASPDLPLSGSALQRLKEANKSFDDWEKHWDGVFSKRFGKTRGDFFRESLVIQRQYAELFVNSQLLRGVRDRSDVEHMPEDKKDLAIRAMRNAQRCVDICLHGQNYRNGLRYAVHYVHVCAAFAASFLIRIARLFPSELNLKQTAKNVEELAAILAEVPAGRYARSLRLILRRARRNNVIPASSAAASPLKSAVVLPHANGQDQHPRQELRASAFAFTPMPLASAPVSVREPVAAQAPVTTIADQVSSGIAAALPIGNGSPGTMFLPPSQGTNTSPSTGADMFEFDALFAQEALERAGITLDDRDNLPLFLDGQSLGAGANTTEMTPFVGIESFFMPSSIDDILGAHMNGGSGSGLLQSDPPPAQDPNLPASETWW